MLNELCSTFDVVACQEYWLAPSKTERFAVLNKHFDVYDVSGMDAALSTGFLRGRQSLHRCIENILTSELHTDVLIVGDTNFACDTKNSGYTQLLQFLCSYNLSDCDDVVSSSSKNTYANLLYRSRVRILQFKSYNILYLYCGFWRQL